MLTISGLKRFYYIPGVTDMRCGYSRLLQTGAFAPLGVSGE